MADRRSVLLVVPRFHNNLYFGTRALVEAGIAVDVFALKIVPAESHDYVSPRRFTGDPEEVRRAFDEVHPALVLIRRAKPLSHRVFRLCRERSVPMVQYSQAPADHRPFVIRRMSDRLRGWPRRRVTPTPPRPGREPAPDVTLLPLPVARTGPAGRMPPRGDDGGLRLLCVAKLAERRKNLPWLVDAIRAGGLARCVRLTLVGSQGGAGDKEQLNWLRTQAEACDWITLKENVPFADMADLYRENDVCILPSFNEPFAIAPLEGAAYGTIPMVTIESGSAGYIRDGENGFCFDPRDARALARRLSDLAGDAALLQRLSKGARELAETTLAPQRFVATIKELIEASD